MSTKDRKLSIKVNEKELGPKRNLCGICMSQDKGQCQHSERLHHGNLEQISKSKGNKHTNLYCLEHKDK
jgi:hypothetical protein